MKETINQRVAHYRKLRDYTQEEMAQLLNIKPSTYSQKERKGKIDVDFLLRLSEILNVDFGELALGDDYKPKIIYVPTPPVEEISKPKPIAEPPQVEFVSRDTILFKIISNFPEKKKDCVCRYVDALRKLKKF